jgi:hypothetical protein
MLKDLKKIYKVWSTSDEYGRNHELIGYFSTKQGADMAAAGKGWWGGNGNVEEGYATKIDGDWYELKQIVPIIIDRDLVKHQEALKKKALAKLSPEELAALNLK